MKISSKKVNVLFINLPSVPILDIENSFNNLNVRLQSISMPLGTLYLSSYLKKYSTAGKIGMVDYVLELRQLLKHKNLDNFIFNLARNINFKPDMIAFSLIFSASYEFFERCLPIISKLYPKAKIVIGGVHATNSVKSLLGIPEVDYVIAGEGEIPFVRFVNQFFKKRKAKIKGVYSKKNIGDAFFEIGEYVINLDEIPFPDWDLIDMEAYVTAQGQQLMMSGIEKRTTSMFTTRGCPGMCTFCSAHTVHGRKMRLRSIENIIEEIKFLNKKYGVTLFLPLDDLFTFDKKRIIALLKRIKELKIPGIEIQTPSALAVNILDEEVVDALIGAGLKIAILAIESGSKFVQQKIIKKFCNLEKAKWLVNLFKNKGVLVRAYFIFGFPRETREQMQETVDYAKSLGIDWCVFSIAAPLVGSEMYKEFVEMGSIEDNLNTWRETVFDHRGFDTPDISADELNDFAYRANLDCNFLNNPNKIKGNFKKAIKIYEDILSRIPYHIIAWYCIMECCLKLKKMKKAKEIKNRIKKLIQSDNRSKEMYLKYKDMMPKYFQI